MAVSGAGQREPREEPHLVSVINAVNEGQGEGEAGEEFPWTQRGEGNKKNML